MIKAIIFSKIYRKSILKVAEVSATNKIVAPMV